MEEVMKHRFSLFAPGINTPKGQRPYKQGTFMDVYQWMNSTTVAWHQGRERAEGVQGKQIALRDIQRHVRLSQARGTYPALRTPMFRLRPPRWQGELMEGETTVGE